MMNMYENIMIAYPHIRERRLEDRLKAVLNHAYGFQVTPNLDELQDHGASVDAVEILRAARDLAVMLIGFPPDERPSGMGAILESLAPPPIDNADT